MGGVGGVNLESDEKASDGKETDRDCLCIPAGEEQVSSAEVVVEVENGTVRGGQKSRKSGSGCCHGFPFLSFPFQSFILSLPMLMFT